MNGGASARSGRGCDATLGRRPIRASGSASPAVTASPVRYAPSLPVHVFRDRRPSTPLYESEARNISRIEHRFNAGVWELKFELNY
jgi:hypothetical protein